MNSKVYSRLISVLVLTMILFACGTSSSSIFEKRKHLKGWHFKKKGLSIETNKALENSIDLASAMEIERSSVRNKQQTLSSDLKVENKISNKNSDKESKYKINARFSNQHFKKSIYRSRISFYNQNLLENSKDNSNLLDSDFPETIGNSFNEEVNTSKKHLVERSFEFEDEPLPPLILSDGEIVAKALIFFLIALSAGGVLSFFVGAFIVGSLMISFVIHLVGTYLILVFLSYYISKLFKREGSGEVWSLKKTFLFVGLIYFSIVALIITAIALML